MLRRKKSTLVLTILAFSLLFITAALVIYFKITYNHMTEKGRDLLWLLDKNEYSQAHGLFDPGAGRVFTADDMAMADGQMDEIIGKSGDMKWAGTYKYTWLTPLTLVIRWKVDYSLAHDPVHVTMSFIKRGGQWRIGGLWFDSREVREKPLLVSARFGEDVDEGHNVKTIRKDFTLDLRYAYAWTLWQGLNGDHSVTMQWVEPSGKVYYTFDYEVGRKPERKSRVVWSRIGLQEARDAIQPGAWKVIIFLDEKPVAEANTIITTQ
ncbi:MAG: hypothetical protein ABIJ56_00900 [Pseudomonadota bacterium]